ncbi:AsmA family protein, partial [Falsiroseomonas sp.]|uniref:AsmA family protein n=1 Tax=Falsiroseomonas sp. TaxID=2870721 RepID=UPI0035651D8A
MSEATRRRRWPWILLVVVVALPLVGFLALRAFVDADTLRPRLVAAVQDATGRDFRVGDIGLALSLQPTLVLEDVALANAPGGSRPEMLTARRVEVQVALLPLLSRRVEVSRVELEQPDLLLETDAQGRGNWQFAPEAPATPATPADPAAPSAPGRAFALDLGALEVEQARIAWRDARSGTAEVVEIPRLTARAPLAGPTTASGTVRLRGQEVALEATTGALAALGGAEPWPYDLRLAVAGAEARARGTLADGGAWTAEAEARAPDLARLAPLLPDAPLPPLREVALTARLAGTGGELATAENLALRVGRSDLSVLRPGLVVNRLELTAPRLDAPLTLAAEAAIGATPLRAAGRLGTPALLLGRAEGAVPVALGIEAAGAAAQVQGQIRDPAAVAGVDLKLAAQVPDLAALSPLAGAPLPAIRDIRAEARLTERTPGFRGGAHLRDIILASPPAQAEGELTLIVGERPGINGRLDVARLDIDAIRAAMPAPAPGQPAQPSPAPAPAAADGRVIPDLPLPVGLLRTLDADLRLAVEQITAGGAPWRDLRAHIRLAAGKGTIEPFSVITPGGPVTAQLAADATGAAPNLRLVTRAPELDLAALQRALGAPVRITGTGELEAQLAGAGASLRAVAATLDGHLGLAVLDSTLEPALTAPVLAALRARVPVLPPLPERLPVECIALRAEAEDGVVRITTLLVDAPAAKVAGTGTIRLADETLALRLLHDLRTAAGGVRVAADVGGTLANPAYGGVNMADAVGAAAGALGGVLGGTAGQVLGAIANRPGAEPAPLPECGPALTAARGGRAGRVP